jgi:hypothetical protein
MRPSSFYLRRALRETEDPEELRKVGLHCVSEYEALRAWVRERGQVPPKFFISKAEAIAKGMIGYPDLDLACPDCSGCAECDPSTD